MKNLTPIQAAFINMRVTQIKREVLAAIVNAKPLFPACTKVPPMTVKSFSELHDYCDANELGGMCDDDVIALGSALFPKGTHSEQLASEGFIEASNEAQNRVHAWLEDGTMRRQANVIAHVLLPEQRDCLLDPERNEEARGMLDDLEGRVGVNPEACAVLSWLLDSDEDVRLVAEFKPEPKTEPTKNLVKESADEALACARMCRDHLVEGLHAANGVEAMLLQRFIAQAAELANAINEFHSCV